MPVTREFLTKFVQQDEWFNGNAYQDHESHHHAVVLVMFNAALDEAAKVIELGMPIEDMRLAGSWTAVTHDVEAAGDYEDHGLRAVDWVENHMQAIIPHKILPLVEFLCWAHVPDPVENWNLPHELKQLLITFKAGDKLHRVRFSEGEDALDESKLPEYAKKLVPDAQELHQRTNKKYANAEAAFMAVIDAAVEMGLVAD